MQTDGWANTPATRMIEEIADSLTSHAGGIEQNLLSKSLQEALFPCLEADADGDGWQFKMRLTRRLANDGAASILQQFLSLYFFNFVWFETAEFFQADAWTAADLEKDIKDVEAVCRHVVDAAWTQFARKQPELQAFAAQELIAGIEQELRGSPAPY